MTNRRRSERYRIELPVLLKDAQGGEQTRTCDVSAHGIAVLATKARHLRQYVELEIALPAPAPAIGVTAIVARLIDDVGDGRRGRGFGLDFFLFDSKAKAEWQKFMARLRAEGAINDNAPRPLPPSVMQGPPPSAGDEGEEEDDGAPTFIIKPRDLGRLWAFFRGELSKGLVRIETPIVKRVGEPVELLVVHPSSRAEWTLEGRVARAIDYGRGGRPVLEIALVGLDQDMRSSFRNFVATGHGMIEEDVQLSTDIPIPHELQEAAKLPPASFNLDEELEVSHSGEDLLRSRRGNSIVIDVDKLARANAEGDPGPLSSEDEALFEEYLEPGQGDFEGLSPVVPLESLDDPSAPEVSVSKVYALGDDAILGTAPVQDSQELDTPAQESRGPEYDPRGLDARELGARGIASRDLEVPELDTPAFGAHDEVTVGERPPPIEEDEMSTSPTVAAVPELGREPTEPLPRQPIVVEARSSSGRAAPVAPSLALEQDPETVEDSDDDVVAAPTPLVQPGSPQSLSGRLFASFFFEAAQSKPPPATIAPASPPALRDVSLPREAPPAIALTKPVKIEAKPAAPPPLPKAAPPPLPPSPPIVRGQEIAVVRGAPVPEPPAAPEPEVDRRGGAPRKDSVKVEPWFEQVGNDALFRPPSIGGETPLPLKERRPQQANGSPRRAAPERRPSGRNALEENTRQPHLQVSTESTDPGLDRDIALARARVVRSPNSVTACYRLGSLLVKRGQLDGWDEAVSTLQRVMTLEPNHPGAHHAIAEALARRGEMDAAAEHLQRARRLGYRIDADLERRINEGRQR